LADEARAAEERAAAERKRLADEEAARARAAAAERQRLADEAAAAAAAGNAEAAAAAALAANNAALEDELAAQQAQQREQAANQQANEEAAALRTAIAVVSAPVTDIATAKASGTSVRKTMDYEVTSLISLVQHVAKHPDLINLLATDSIKLKAYVRGLGINTNLPGVRVFEKRSMSARAA
jgi:leucyl aminopeptidase (aminopeptidase T)